MSISSTIALSATHLRPDPEIAALISSTLPFAEVVGIPYACTPTPTLVRSPFLFAQIEGYAGAVSISLTIALGATYLTKRAARLGPGVAALIRSTLPFAAVAGAGSANVALMRRTELVEGVEVQDSEGTLLDIYVYFFASEMPIRSLFRSLFYIYFFLCVFNACMHSNYCFTFIPINCSHLYASARRCFLFSIHI